MDTRRAIGHLISSRVCREIGYFVTYLYAKAGHVAMKNYAHGSGSLNSEATLTYQNLDRSTHDVNSDYNDFAQDCIQFKEDVSMVYAPMRIAVGNGYYAANPLDYSSLLKEKTWVKNFISPAPACTMKSSMLMPWIRNWNSLAKIR